VDLSLKVHDHDGLHLGHLWLELFRGQVALPVRELVVAEPVFGQVGWEVGGR
jgi:hypothetical protein